MTPAQLAALSAGVEQRRRDMGEAQATATSLESSLRLARQQVTMLEPLAAKGVVPQTELPTAQREVVDIQGRLAAARQAISRSQAAVREAGAEVSRARFDFQQEALNERSQLTTKMAVNQETIDETRECQCQEQRPRDGIELPALGCNLACTALKQQCQSAHQKVQQHQFDQPSWQRLAGRCQRPYHQPAMVDEGQVRGYQRRDDDQPNRSGERHGAPTRATWALRWPTHAPRRRRTGP